MWDAPKNKLTRKSYFFMFAGLQSNHKYFFVSNIFISSARIRFDWKKYFQVLRY